MSTRLEDIRNGNYVPLIGTANTADAREEAEYRRMVRIAPWIDGSADAPEEGEASERHTREVITYTDESTTLGEVLRTAQALENAGFEARVRFTRQHDETGMVWGLSIGVRERAS